MKLSKKTAGRITRTARIGTPPSMMNLATNGSIDIPADPECEDYDIPPEQSATKICGLHPLHHEPFFATVVLDVGSCFLRRSRSVLPTKSEARNPKLEIIQ